MCGAISTPCATEGCEAFTKEIHCLQCQANLEHLTGV
jgi:hypothetical protein